MEHLKSIYRSFDIRGEYPTEINETEAKKVAQAMSVVYQPSIAVVGHDYRPSSQALYAAVVEGFLAQGVDVIALGLVTTPMLYFGAGTYDSDVSIMVSGSHMAPQFNGLKPCIKHVVPIGLEYGLDTIRDIVQEDNFPAVTKSGTRTEVDIKPKWIAHCQSLITFDESKPIKVVVDPANMVGILEIETLQSFPALEVIPLYDTYDWSLPNHEANPMKLDTMKDLGEKVRAVGAAIGIALDGDADRIGIVDEIGTPVTQDVIGIMIASELLQQKKGLIIQDVRSSKHIGEVVTKLGGEILPYRIGHTHLRRKMAETNALYAFELTGHHFFKEMYNSEGGIYPALLLMQIMQRDHKKLSTYSAEHIVYFHSTEINSTITRTSEEIYEALRANFADATFETIDGLTIKYDDWWCNVRPSANDPVMRMNLEADNKKLMESKRDEVLAIIRAE